MRALAAGMEIEGTLAVFLGKCGAAVFDVGLSGNPAEWRLSYCRPKFALPNAARTGGSRGMPKP